MERSERKGLIILNFYLLLLRLRPGHPAEQRDACLDGKIQLCFSGTRFWRCVSKNEHMSKGQLDGPGSANAQRMAQRCYLLWSARHSFPHWLHMARVVEASEQGVHFVKKMCILASDVGDV